MKKFVDVVESRGVGADKLNGGRNCSTGRSNKTKRTEEDRPCTLDQRRKK